MIALKYEHNDRQQIIRVDYVDVARLQNQNMLLEQANHALEHEHRAAYRRLLVSLLRKHAGFTSDSVKLARAHSALTEDFFGRVEE